jgi:16S rRNA (guanine966-N2)-methyltransferase
MPKARIIAGTHRRLMFETGDLPHTRPVKDRVKESMFNQLEPFHYERALDAFAGVGSLSFEAISRGASWVNAVEKAPDTYRLLTQNIRSLALPVKAIHMDIMDYLSGPPHPYDLVFLDPPYKASLLTPVLSRLKDAGWLAKGARLVCLHEDAFDAPGFDVLGTRKVGRTSITRLKEAA